MDTKPTLQPKSGGIPVTCFRCDTALLSLKRCQTTPLGGEQCAYARSSVNGAETRVYIKAVLHKDAAANEDYCEYARTWLKRNCG